MPSNRTGKNICTYPKINTSGLCGKTCDAHYCGTHILIERKGLPLPKQCEKCGLYFRRRKLPSTLCPDCGKMFLPEVDFEMVINPCLNPFPIYEKLLQHLGTESITSVVGEIRREDWKNKLIPEYAMVFRVKTRQEAAVDAYTVALLKEYEPRPILPKYHLNFSHP